MNINSPSPSSRQRPAQVLSAHYKYLVSWGLLLLLLVALGGAFFFPQLCRLVHSSSSESTTPTHSLSSTTVADKPLKPTTLEALGVDNSLELPINWTAYFVTPVQTTSSEKGRAVTFIDRDGGKHRIYLDYSSYRQAEIEAVAVGLDPQGRKRFAYRLSEGVWKELPEGSAGMGNKVNPLVPLLHVAADQRKFPYASMIYLPLAVGYHLRDGRVLDGYFWVSDVGGAVLGNHFDLFVGDQEIYQNFIKMPKQKTYPTTVYPLPTAPKGLDPRNAFGLAAILRAENLLTDPTDPPLPEKLAEALLAFQQSHPHIPQPEYGNATAATTLWFLTQSALKTARQSMPSTQ